MRALQDAKAAEKAAKKAKAAEKAAVRDAKKDAGETDKQKKAKADAEAKKVTTLPAVGPLYTSQANNSDHAAIAAAAKA